MPKNEDQSIQILTDTMNFRYDSTNCMTDNYFLHCHNFYEVYFFLEGDVDYQAEGKKYKPAPNSLLLLPPHMFHGVKINTASPYRRFSMHFHPNLLSPDRRTFLLSAFPPFEKNPTQNIYFEPAEHFGFPVYFEALRACASKPQYIKEQQLPICAEALLSQIVSLRESVAQPTHNPAADTVSQIIWYLNRHLGEEISLDQISDRFFISKHHLNKIFRKATGTTVFDYLLRKRVIAAQQLLFNGSSAQNAASASGFKDYSAFYRSYIRILGHSPLKDKGALPSPSLSAPNGMEEIAFTPDSN